MAQVLPHLLVDGSNVLHAWPETARLLRRDRNSARSQLIHALAQLHDTRECRVTIVFDGRGADLAVERPSDETTFSILTTPAGVTADDLIEKLVVQGSAPTACVVATADAAVRETVTAAGAHAIDPAELATWIAGIVRNTRRHVRRMNQRTRQAFEFPPGG